ncbi:MAG: endonuclease MutS2, partial [Pseudobdellovibrio sp.]
LITPSCDIRMDASERLYRLSKEKDQLARQIQNQMDKIVKDHQIEHMLQERFVTTREGRWVIPVKGGMQHFVPGVIHASSQSKQTVYIEPEAIIPVNNRLRQVEVEIEDEIERLLIEVSNYLSTQKNGFEKSEQELLRADLILAKAQLTIQVGAQPCHFSQDKVELKELFHPLLKLNGKNVIANTVILSKEKSILILSGPNAGGKTVLLKSIGLASQMARCGLPICADRSSTIPFFNEICTGIGDSQSVDEDLSTFAAHLKTLDQALKLKGSDNLILVDEICGSTDPEEGSALARAFIETYASHGVFAVITSHLSPLKTGWKPDDVVINGSLEYDTQSGKPTYQFLPGIPGDSLALLTAKRVGVDQSIIDKATENLSPLAQKKLSQLEEIENLKRDISTLQQKYKKELKIVEQKKLTLDAQLQQFERQKENELEKTIKKASLKVDDAIATVKAAATLNKHRELQGIKFNLPEIVKGNAVPSQAPSQSQYKSADEFAKRFPPGTKVFVPSLNQDGIIQSLPNSKGEVLILSQSIRLQMNWQDLKPAQKFGNPTSQLVQRNPGVHISFHDDDRTLDLRGKTVETALSELEIALDKAALQKEDRLKIIHGHGTESLKKSIRSYLSRSVYVKKWKAGSPESGGDGVTWVELGM